MSKHWRFALPLFFSLTSACTTGVTEFCLEGQLDLGARYQGLKAQAGEFYPTTWCVISEDDSNRVLYSASGKSNPDMNGDWAVAYLPPDRVRIVNRDAPPDIEFHGTDNPDEARRVRRIDPRRLFKEYATTPDVLGGMRVTTLGSRVTLVETSAELPLRGLVAVIWQWDWSDPEQPVLQLKLNDVLLFKATGHWRDVPVDEAATLWKATPGVEPVSVPGDRWPARVDMKLISLTDDVYVVRGVRTGFQHFVVDTDEGLVIADAPAGWVEFHHLPPSDLVPGLGVSGLSEQLIDFLHQQFPSRPIRTVALTHFHDDHAGGARAFPAAGADIYAPAQSAQFLVTALNLPSMPADRQARTESVDILPVSDPVTLGSPPNRVRLLPMGAGPHAYAMLGVWAVDKDYFFVSDVHVPQSDADVPSEDRAVTECWFARWATDHLPPDVRVVNSHSATVTPVARLARYLDSELCAASHLMSPPS